MRCSVPRLDHFSSDSILLIVTYDQQRCRERTLLRCSVHEFISRCKSPISFRRDLEVSKPAMTMTMTMTMSVSVSVSVSCHLSAASSHPTSTWLFCCRWRRTLQTKLHREAVRCPRSACTQAAFSIGLASWLATLQPSI